MKKMPREILHIFCAVALAVAAIPVGTLAQEIVQETEVIMETFTETIEEVLGETETVVAESETLEVVLEEETVETETVEAAETEVIAEETEVEETVLEEVQNEPETTAVIAKHVTITSEVLGGGAPGDIFRLRCTLYGYEEGTYDLQWQYMPTDWYGNHIGSWTDVPGANGSELDVQINEINALKAWRVVVNEK